MSTDAYAVATTDQPLDAQVVVPGSKSIANRALICATLANGFSTLRNMPAGDDTVAMLQCIERLGAGIGIDSTTVTVGGVNGVLRPGPLTLHAQLAGTTSRFITALCALGSGVYEVDGHPPLRQRPMGPLHEALTQLGCQVDPVEHRGHLPVRVRGHVTDVGGRQTVTLPGDVSSQYITALMLIAPYLAEGLQIVLSTPLVSRPYVLITQAVMRSFGVDGISIGPDVIEVPAGRYQAIDYSIEPDASSASYMFAAAAICAGRVGVAGLGKHALQGDARFVELLAEMGCSVTIDEWGTWVSRDATMRGISVNMADLSDLVPTLAVVAPFAQTVTTITGVGFIRAKESDRLGDLAAELQRCGIAAGEQPDGITIAPSTGHAARLGTHHDHRLAMAFGVLGLAVEGIVVQDPSVVSKSWPDFWNTLEGLVDR